jgi:hypothetical protein
VADEAVGVEEEGEVNGNVELRNGFGPPPPDPNPPAPPFSAPPSGKDPSRLAPNELLGLKGWTLDPPNPVF